MVPAKPTLAIVIVSWNVRELLRGCLASLLADAAQSGVATRVIVVDSASADGTPEMVRAEFPTVELIARETNLGYVKGNNLALTHLQDEEFVWLLNPDTVVQQGAIRTLLDFMAAHPRCGLCGPQLQNPDGSLQHGAFALPGLIQLAIDVVPRLQARLRDTHWDGRYSPAQYGSHQPFQIGSPLGAAMLARVAAVHEIGMLDEGFEMYCEELDWAKRMRDAKWEVWCAPAAVVTHFGGASSSQASERVERLKWQSRQRYYAKHYAPVKHWLAQRLVPGPFRQAETKRSER